MIDWLERKCQGVSKAEKDELRSTDVSRGCMDQEVQLTVTPTGTFTRHLARVHVNQHAASNVLPAPEPDVNLNESSRSSVPLPSPPGCIIRR